MKAKFVVLEGLDGSGTSTQASMLEAAWAHSGLKTMLTSEPSPGPLGNLIRQAFKGRVRLQADPELFDEQMAYLFAADRFDHLYNDFDGVIPMLNKGVSVVSTRYFFSSFAYHCTKESHWALVRRLNQDFPAPDLTVYLRNPVSESMRRLARRPLLDTYEEEAKLTRVYENYERIFAEFSGPKLILEATADRDEIHRQILDKLDAIYE